MQSLDIKYSQNQTMISEKFYKFNINSFKRLDNGQNSFNTINNNNNNNNNRKDESFAIRVKFPTKIPIIVERYAKDQELPLLDGKMKRKFLVPQEITLSHFLSILRSRMKLHHSRAIFLIVNNRTMVALSKTIAEIYVEYKNPDGFLYITYASQEVFGR